MTQATSIEERATEVISVGSQNILNEVSTPKTHIDSQVTGIWDEDELLRICLDL